MSIILLGKTKCPVCAKMLEEGQEFTVFPALISNECDPLWELNEVAFHAECFPLHPLASEAEERLAEWELKRLGGRTCSICHGGIAHPDDYIGFPHFTRDAGSPLFPYNYAEFHRGCLEQWEGLPRLVKCMSSLYNSDQWSGESLGRLLKKLEGLLATR